jgi:hypothetical protein
MVSKLAIYDGAKRRRTRVPTKTRYCLGMVLLQQMQKNAKHHREAMLWKATTQPSVTVACKLFT